jgi:myo-inositol-1(or 4)-monophosphatase
MPDFKKIIASALSSARETYLTLAEKGEIGIERGLGAFGDVSTMGDVACEEKIIEIITTQMDDVSIVTEERGIIGDIQNSKYLVLIDPIDGSTNMKRGLRFFSSGIAIFEGPRYEDLAAAGVIDIPSGQLFLADREGVYIEDSASSAKSPSSSKKLDSAVISLDFRPLKRGGEAATRFLKLCQKVRYVRNLGSSLLEICQIVVGKIDAFVCLSPELRLFDLIPALFILEKAGGCWLMDKHRIELTETMIKDRYAVIAASNNSLLKEIVNVTSLSWPLKYE